MASHFDYWQEELMNMRLDDDGCPNPRQSPKDQGERQNGDVKLLISERVYAGSASARKPFTNGVGIA